MAEVISFFSKAKWKVLLSQVTYSEKEQGKDTVLRDQNQRTLCCVPLVYSISPRKKSKIQNSTNQCKETRLTHQSVGTWAHMHT